MATPSFRHRSYTPPHIIDTGKRGSMTQTQACRPCAKRKVRCDRSEPCSNCKRRKTDQCIYPASSRPDGPLQQLGSRSRNDDTSFPAVRQQDDTNRDGDLNRQMRSNDPMLLQGDGAMQYLESRVWRNWQARDEGQGTSHPWMQHTQLHAMAGSTVGPATTQPSIDRIWLQQSESLWTVFSQRVEPLVKVLFRWQITELHLRSQQLDTERQVGGTRTALVLAIFYASANSLTEDESLCMFDLSRTALLADCQALCEDALLRTNLFCIKDIATIKAVIFYLIASLDRVSTQSLWSLLGMTIRNAEKLGLHRDGSILGLSPVDIEDRRRVWWQLQHLDLVAAVRMGLTSMTLTAGWDTKLPSNIEDTDISATSTGIPNGRRGLTSISYCLFTYWVLERQRKTFLSNYGRFELSWQTNSMLPAAVKNDVVSELENGINEHFLQYCDPIKPLDVLLQLFGRLFVTSFRLRILHARVCEDGSKEDKAALVDPATRTLRYNIAIQTQPSLVCFRWLTKAWFAWQAFMCVLVEARDASNASEVEKAQELWNLLGDVYAAHPDLVDFTNDRRRIHAAELVVAAWNAQQGRPSLQRLEKPQCVNDLSRRLTAHHAHDNAQQREGESQTTLPDATGPSEMDLSFDIDFGDIDWGFWNSID